MIRLRRESILIHLRIRSPRRLVPRPEWMSRLDDVIVRSSPVRAEPFDVAMELGHASQEFGSIFDGALVSVHLASHCRLSRQARSRMRSLSWKNGVPWSWVPSVGVSGSRLRMLEIFW